MKSPKFITHQPYCPNEPLTAVQKLRKVLGQRRSVRDFSDEGVPSALIEEVVACASTAPSGANKQPWRFVCVSNPKLKKKIRMAAEVEEREFYENRASDQWKDDLAPLGTDADKMFLETAPWLIVVFRLVKDDDGGNVYYSDESVGIATGMLLAAAQIAGLATLTHTPSPMKFLADVLGRPDNERAYMLIPIGWPAARCEVPAAAVIKKPLSQVMVNR
ncbi:MAG: nitroreductase family protein [Planctomycetes bacterium]|nr:nitroreductase family protein [Planctomycetota bacterium]